MVFVGFVKKITSEMFKQIKLKDDSYWLNRKEILCCELCGIVLDSSPGSITLCDFYGKITFFKKPDMPIDEKSLYVFTIKIYSKNGSVFGFCKNVRKTTIYEEIAFNVELHSLIENLCY